MMNFFDTNDIRALRGMILKAQVATGTRCEVHVHSMLMPTLEIKRAEGSPVLRASPREVGEISCKGEAMRKMVSHISDNIFAQTASWNQQRADNLVKTLHIGIYKYGQRTVQYGTAVVYSQEQFPKVA